MQEPVRRMPWGGQTADVEPLLSREWLVANGLGGFATGTVAGVCTRRYHGLLVAALPAPLGRVVMLSHLSELVRLPDKRVLRLSGEEFTGRLELSGAPWLEEFRLEAGLPVWRFRVDGHLLEKQVWMAHLQNTVYVTYRLVEGPGPLRLKLRPAVNFRHYEAPVSQSLARPYAVSAQEGHFEVTAPGKPPLRMRALGACSAFTVDSRTLDEYLYRVEGARGYEDRGEVWTPGYFRVDLAPGQPATLCASTESWGTLDALAPDEALEGEQRRRAALLRVAHPAARAGVGAELTLAADAFVISPAGRTADEARAHASGDEVRTVIAGYHWFTDWGRDTMISLEGLCLCTGRHLEAGYILRTFGHYVRDGLIPNMFPDGENQGLYHTADATLWFFHALDRYLAYTSDRATLQHLLPTLLSIVEKHLGGTRFGIGVDPADGLLRQGAPGYQLTWMDAKVDDWVVTPRRGKAVEINALWYNALRLLEGWVRQERGEEAARPLEGHARRAYEGFNRRFWSEGRGHLLDVVDAEGGGDDPACRPNQLLALALPHPVLAPERWAPVLEVVRQRLLTPVGLRSLAPGHPDYKPRYFGDLRTRDAAYHQGTVWGWLAGPFVDAWLRVHPGDRAGARRYLEGFVPHLGEACLGSISEIFDAEDPFTPRGCIAQAWSVAEVLRGWCKTEPEG